MAPGYSVFSFAALAAAVVEGMQCPGSSAMIHASMELTVKASASCADVQEEMLARVQGQPSAWHDPHNDGTYATLSDTSAGLLLSRTTANKKYTDKMLFTFSDDGAGTCTLSGCSESQVFSIADFSTNYCNLRMLYCGSAEGCKPVKHGFAIEETDVSPSIGAGKDPAACLKVSTVETSSLRGDALAPLEESSSGAQANDAMSCVIDSCSAGNMSSVPSPWCALTSCGSKLGHCLISSACRSAVYCQAQCITPVKQTDDEPRFMKVAQCVHDHCPGFPPSDTCVALHCAVPAAACALHSACRDALKCVSGCGVSASSIDLSTITQAASDASIAV